MAPMQNRLPPVAATFVAIFQTFIYQISHNRPCIAGFLIYSSLVYRSEVADTAIID